MTEMQEVTGIMRKGGFVGCLGKEKWQSAMAWLNKAILRSFSCLLIVHSHKISKLLSCQ